MLATLLLEWYNQSKTLENSVSVALTQSSSTCSKSTTETQEEGVKYVQS